MDFPLLTVNQWNNWWEEDFEKSKGKKEQEQGDEHGDHECPFGEISPMLKKHIKQMLPDKEHKRIFLPLCGKATDMKWLSDEGYQVVGLECSEHAILGFFKDHSIEYETSTSPHNPEFRVYKAKAGDLTIFQGDYFKFTTEIAGGPFDSVWDSASLNTIDLATRKAYVEVMKSLLTKHCKYVLDAMYFGDKRTWAYNPYDISDKDMTDLFSADFVWTKIDEDDSEWGLERVFLLTFK